MARLLEATGIDPTDGGGIPELVKFQEHFDDYKIVIYDGLHCDNIIFQEQTGPLNALTCYLMTSLVTIT